MAAAEEILSPIDNIILAGPAIPATHLRGLVFLCFLSVKVFPALVKCEARFENVARSG